MSTALDVLGYIGLAFGVLLLLAVALVLFAANYQRRNPSQGCYRLHCELQHKYSGGVR